MKIKKLSPTSYFKNYLYENPELNKGKRCKVTIDEFHILNFSEYDLILTKNYNVSQLKSICRYYKLKISGKVKILTGRNMKGVQIYWIFYVCAGYLAFYILCKFCPKK